MSSVCSVVEVMAESRAASSAGSSSHSAGVNPLTRPSPTCVISRPSVGVASGSKVIGKRSVGAPASWKSSTG